MNSELSSVTNTMSEHSEHEISRIQSEHSYSTKSRENQNKSEVGENSDHLPNISGFSDVDFHSTPTKPLILK